MKKFTEILDDINSGTKRRVPGQMTGNAVAKWRKMDRPDRRTMEAISAWELQPNVRRLAQAEDERAVMDLRSSMVIATASHLIEKAAGLDLIGSGVTTKPNSLKELFDSVNGVMFSVDKKEREVWQGKRGRFDFDGQDSFQSAQELRTLKENVHKLTLYAPIPVEDRNEREHKKFIDTLSLDQ